MCHHYRDNSEATMNNAKIVCSQLGYTGGKYMPLCNEVSKAKMQALISGMLRKSAIHRIIKFSCIILWDKISLCESLIPRSFIILLQISCHF